MDRRGVIAKVRMRMFFFLVGVFFWGIVNANSISGAKNFNNAYILEQAKSKEAPDVTAYITGSKIKPDSVFTGNIGDNISISQGGEAEPFASSGEGIHYIVLVDNSGSVSPKQLSESKKELVKLRKKMRAQDKMTLYTVGTMSAGGHKSNVLRSGDNAAAGNEKSEIIKDIKKIKEIKYRQSAKSRTVLYRSINEVLAKNGAPAMRTVVLLVTDGEDDSTGQYNTKESTMKNVQNAMVPVYGIKLYNKAQKPNHVKMKNTDRILEEENGRGLCFDVSSNQSSQKVRTAFASFQNVMMKGTYVVHLTAPNNKKVNGISKIVLSEKRGGSVTGRIDYSRSRADTTPPEISNIEKSKSNAITFTITDDSGNVVGAGETANYIVKEKDGGENGKIWAIQEAKYNSVNNTVVLTFKDELYTGDYTLSCSNIYDDTEEANKINQSYDFSFEGLSESSEKTKQFIKSYWWVALIVLVLLIGLIVIIIIKRKPGKIVEVNPDDLLKADTKLIRLTITDRAGTIKDIEWNVEGSLFVGRSDICNIYFDDDRLSKQHFVIEVTKMACYIEDLESTNGTFVNGVKIGTRRMLLDDDVITAGREKFVFHTIKNEAVAEDE